jgi:membrane protease YdiL (CAAX protease family)
MNPLDPQNSDGASGYPGAPWAVKAALTRGEHLKFPTWGMGDAVIALLGYGVIGFSMSLFLMSQNIDPQNSWGLIIAFGSPWIALAGWPLYIAIKKGNGPKLDFGLTAPRTHLRLGVVAGLASIFLASILAIIIQQITGPFNSAAADVGSNQTGLVLLVFALMAMFGAPIVEEIAFRGLLYGALVKAHISERWVVVITAAIFALTHFEPQRFILLFAIGLLFGELRRRTGSTSAAIMAHIVNNTPGAIVILFSPLIG